jgi:transposase
MFSTGRFRRALFVVLMLGGWVAPAWAQPQAPLNNVALYRVFLNDGTTLLSYGEYARVADRVVVSLPMGIAVTADETPSLHLVSIPSDTVDWEKTDAYADSVRATRYGATRGPDDFALLSEAVSRALTDIALTTDPTRKIEMAIEARQNVTRWVAEHYGYRADRVAQMASLFDEVVAETRAGAGVKNFDLSLIANTAAPPSVPLLPAPSLQESVEQALRAAALAPEATERTSLLRAIERVLADAGRTGEAWMMPMRARVGSALAVEERAIRGYEALTREALGGAERAAQRADVTGVERIIRRALSEDDRLGQRRPQEMASLLAMLDGRLDAARRLRLARDTWAARSELVSQYRASIAQPVSMMRLSRDALDQIRRLAGPSRARLARLADRTAAASKLMAVIAAPAEGSAAHALLTSAIQLASRAAAARQHAVLSGDMKHAWEASSAAAGALMLLDRAAEDLQALARIPAMQAPR